MSDCAILNHLRRLKMAPKKCQEATRHLNQNSLGSLLAMVQLPRRGPCAMRSGQVLQPNVPEVTLDSDGWPKDLTGEDLVGSGSDQELGLQEEDTGAEDEEEEGTESVACSRNC